MNREDEAYLVSRLRRVVELLHAGETHMAIAKLNADIAALSAPERDADDGCRDCGLWELDYQQRRVCYCDPVRYRRFHPR